MENTETCISIRHVSRTFGKQKVLEDINLDIQQGEIFGLLGPSGAGKTTLVKQLAGLDMPTAGENFLLGEKLPAMKLIQRIGYMTQADALYEDLTAKENLQFFAALYGLTGKKQKERMKEVMDIVELSDHHHKLVSKYSGGMKRRLSLAIALLHNPEVLILDEPTVGIDPLLRKSIWETFYQLNKEGTTIIITTHVMDEAGKCHRLGLMRDGEMIAVGSPAALMEKTETDSLEAAFLSFGGAQ